MRLAIIMALGVAALAVTGCSKNESASAACGTIAGASACETCCTSNGATGYKYVGTCSCLGGKEGAAAPAPAGGGAATSFAGTYKSTWGPTVFTQDGNKVSAKYPNGSMTCTATGPVLDCDWREAAGFGKARLTREASGQLKGTWGNGGSATNGGGWIFNP